MLLLAEKGILKRTARYLHETGSNADGPFIVYDPAKDPIFLTVLHDREKCSFGGLDAVQMAALFGVEKGDGIAAATGTLQPEKIVHTCALWRK